MDEITRRDMDGGLNTFRESCDIMNAPMFPDDRVAVLGGFLRTCDSMMSDFESVCDGIEPCLMETDGGVPKTFGRIATLELWMSDDPFVVQ